MRRRKKRPFAVAVVDDMAGDAVALRNGAIVPAERLAGDAVDAQERRVERYACYLNRCPSERRGLLKRLRREKHLRNHDEPQKLLYCPETTGCMFWI